MASMSAVALRHRLFCLPRDGHTADECQDAAAADADRGRFAIADGAGESSFAALWARLLVEEFVHQGSLPAELTTWLPALQRRWETEARRWAHGPSLPWYLEAGLDRGAFATFLALSLDEKGWHALAVGDSCLFQVRGEALLQAFPLTRSAEFDNSPWLVGSRTSADEVAGKQALHLRGRWQPHDRILLATDALAQALLAQDEQGEAPWRQIAQIVHKGDADDAFGRWVEQLRRSRRLRNDDVTLLAIDL
jgi:hypothetical protein